MIHLQIRLPLAAAAILCLLQAISVAEVLDLDGHRPTCGKVCKLVCETKKLTSIGYGSECKDICLPDPSRAGCKHCAVCYGKCAGEACGNCQSCPPKCEFCWRDWFACGCAQPRTVRVLTKYQAEKKICWYHWEVVNATCCDCISQSGPAEVAEKNAATHAGRSIYKSAPKDAEVGAVLPVSDAEWVKLAAVLSPDPTEVAASAFSDAASRSDGSSAGEVTSADPGSKAPSVADRLQQMLKK
jgi:hypothetical protein